MTRAHRFSLCRALPGIFFARFTICPKRKADVWALAIAADSARTVRISIDPHCQFMKDKDFNWKFVWLLYMPRA